MMRENRTCTEGAAGSSKIRSTFFGGSRDLFGNSHSMVCIARMRMLCLFVVPIFVQRGLSVLKETISGTTRSCPYT